MDLPEKVYEEDYMLTCLFELNVKEETDVPDNEFTTKTWKEDLSLIVEGKRLYVTKVILALASPVFERMFQADFKEKENDELELPGKKYDDVKEFLKCIYPSIMKDVNIQNAYQVVALADEYQVLILKSKCEACFLSNVNEKASASFLYSLIDLAHLYSLDNLFLKCTSLAAQKTVAELDQAEEQSSIPLEAKTVIQRKIIKKMETKIAEENEVIDDLNANLQRMSALYNYHRVGCLKNDQLSLDDYQNWSGACVFTQIDTNKYRPRLSTCNKMCTVEICRTRINLEFKFKDSSFQLYLSVPKSEVENIEFKLVGKIVVVNGLSGKNDFSKLMNLTFRNCFYTNNVSILKQDEVLGDAGYIYNGIIGIEVHMLAIKVPDIK